MIAGGMFEKTTRENQYTPILIRHGEHIACGLVQRGCKNAVVGVVGQQGF